MICIVLMVNINTINNLFAYDLLYNYRQCFSSIQLYHIHVIYTIDVTKQTSLTSIHMSLKTGLSVGLQTSELLSKKQLTLGYVQQQRIDTLFHTYMKAIYATIFMNRDLKTNKLKYILCKRNFHSISYRFRDTDQYRSITYLTYTDEKVSFLSFSLRLRND